MSKDTNTGRIYRFKVYRKGIGMVVVNLQWQRLMGSTESPCRLCEKYHQCAKYETACEQFQHYVETGDIELILPREPMKEIFMEVYYEEELQGEF